MKLLCLSAASTTSTRQNTPRRPRPLNKMIVNSHSTPSVNQSADDSSGDEEQPEEIN